MAANRLFARGTNACASRRGNRRCSVQSQSCGRQPAEQRLLTQRSLSGGFAGTAVDSTVYTTSHAGGDGLLAVRTRTASAFLWLPPPRPPVAFARCCALLKPPALRPAQARRLHLRPVAAPSCLCRPHPLSHVDEKRVRCAPGPCCAPPAVYGAVVACASAALLLRSLDRTGLAATPAVGTHTRHAAAPRGQSSSAGTSALCFLPSGTTQRCTT